MIAHEIMAERYNAITQAVVGYQKTGIPLIAHGPKGLAPAGITDDVGIYYFIPEIVRHLHVSVDHAVDFFFTGIVVLSFAVGLIGSLLLFKTGRGRCAAIVGLLIVTYLHSALGDVYVVPSALALAAVPWFLYALTDRAPIYSTLIVGVLGGLAIGTAHYVRSHAGTALLVFVVTLLLLGRRCGVLKRMVMAVAVSIGVLLSVLSFAAVIAERDAYLVSHHVALPEAHHGFWHSVYLGLGFLNNRHGLRYEDAVAVARATQRSPRVVPGSLEYERILRKEVFDLLKRDPRLVGQTIFAKIGVLLFYLGTLGSVGLALAVRRTNPPHVDAAFATAIAFGSLPAILIMPWASYLTGAMAFCILHGMVGIENAAARRASSDVRSEGAILSLAARER